MALRADGGRLPVNPDVHRERFQSAAHELAQTRSDEDVGRIQLQAELAEDARPSVHDLEQAERAAARIHADGRRAEIAQGAGWPLNQSGADFPQSITACDLRLGGKLNRYSA